MRRLVLLVALAGVSPAHADPDADALTAEGEQLAKDGDYSRAIDAFKRADARAPSARHACLIGVAYMRRELWSQAEIFLDSCKARATASDPLPEWFDAAVTQLADKLKAVDTAALEIHVSPPGTGARVSISSFPPDETFEPRTIHVVPGNYVVTATAPGQPPVSETVAVRLGAANIVTVVLPTPAPPPPPPPHRPLPPPQPAHSSSLSRYLLIGAGGAAVLGVGLHAFAYYERGKLSDASAGDDVAGYADHQGAFEAARGATFAFYGLAAVAAVAGVVLRSRDDHAPALTGAIGPSGAFVGFEVRR